MTKLQDIVSAKQALKNKNFIRQSNKDKQKAKTKRLKSLGKDPTLLFLPMASELMLQKLVDIGNIFSNLNSDIEQLNDDIEQFNNEQVGNKQSLINRKNALLNQINSAEKKINSINKILKQLKTVITIFQTITITLKALPLPTSPVPVTVGVINTLSSLLEKTNKTITAFKAVINLIEAELNQIKVDLVELKSQIKLIEDKIENDVIQSSSEQQQNVNFEDVLTQQVQIGLSSVTYNGFKFAIKEETAPGAPIVSGFKRHYAVAIDTNDVEVLKTDMSFTLDTQVLIDQLKFIIESEGLKP